MDLKEAGDFVYIVGETRAELGGSLYHRLHGALGEGVPAPVPQAWETMRALHQAVRHGYVQAMHDLSEGGLGVAAAEMTIAGRMGLELNLAAMPRSAEVDTESIALFAESSARFLVEVSPESARAFEAVLASCPNARIGTVTSHGILHMRGLEGDTLVECSIDILRKAWQSSAVN